MKSIIEKIQKPNANYQKEIIVTSMFKEDQNIVRKVIEGALLGNDMQAHITVQGPKKS